jgi:plasmid stabilization system protein ParE
MTDGILSALRVLEAHPLVGRPARDGLRELVIGRGRRGFVALYRFDEVRDLVRVLTLRHQREAGYPGR